MKTEVKVTIHAPRNAVWQKIADIPNAAQTISEIQHIEVLEKPSHGLVGLKWKETRTMFGKTATETMWITDAKEPEFYKTRAESHGSIYETCLALKDVSGGTELAMEFSATPVTLAAKVMWGLTGFMFKGATQKAIAKDLADIKAAVEKANRPT